MPRFDPQEFITQLSQELPACEVLDRTSLVEHGWTKLALITAAETLPLQIFTGDAERWVPRGEGPVSDEDAKRIWQALLRALPLEPITDLDSGTATSSQGSWGGGSSNGGGAMALPNAFPFEALVRQAIASARQKIRTLANRLSRNGNDPRRQLQLRQQILRDVMVLKADTASQVELSRQITEQLAQVENLLNGPPENIEQAKSIVEACKEAHQHAIQKGAPEGVESRTWQAISRVSALVTLVMALNSCVLAPIDPIDCETPEQPIIVQIQEGSPWVSSSVNIESQTLRVHVGPFLEAATIDRLPIGHPVEVKKGTEENGLVLIRYRNTDGRDLSGYVAIAHLKQTW